MVKLNPVFISAAIFVMGLTGGFAAFRAHQSEPREQATEFRTLGWCEADCGERAEVRRIGIVYYNVVYMLPTQTSSQSAQYMDVRAERDRMRADLDRLLDRFAGSMDDLGRGLSCP